MITLERKSSVLDCLGISKSTLSNRINAGLFPPPVSIGARAVAWPSEEIDVLVRAQIAGKSLEEQREIVSALIQKRTDEVA
jgi:prophage regulatory protein